MLVHAAQTAKLLTRKNETAAASPAPNTRNTFVFRRSMALPSQIMPPYQAQVTAWSQGIGYPYTNFVRITSDAASSTTGTHAILRDPRAPKNSNEAATGVNISGCGRKRYATANRTNRYANMITSGTSNQNSGPCD